METIQGLTLLAIMILYVRYESEFCMELRELDNMMKGSNEN